MFVKERFMRSHVFIIALFCVICQAKPTDKNNLRFVTEQRYNKSMKALLLLAPIAALMIAVDNMTADTMPYVVGGVIATLVVVAIVGLVVDAR